MSPTVNNPIANLPFLTLMLSHRFLLASYAQMYPRVITLAVLHALHRGDSKGKMIQTCVNEKVKGDTRLVKLLLTCRLTCNKQNIIVVLLLQQILVVLFNIA